MTQSAFTRRGDLLRRLCAYLRRRKRLDPEARALLAEADAALEDNRGRPRVLSREDAEAAVKQHGTVEAAAKALGRSPTTVRNARKG